MGSRFNPQEELDPLSGTIIDRPIFIVGMPRSGSTAFHHAMAYHPDLGTTTNVTRKFPTCLPMIRLAGLVKRDHEPGEAGTMWDRFVSDQDDILRAEDADPEKSSYYRKAVANVLTYYGKSRFISKCPRNGLRMSFLHAIFPDARFIHLIRDGRAVCQSLLERRTIDNGDLNVWWDVKPPGWKEMEALPPLESVAAQWQAVVKLVTEFGSVLPNSQYMEIRYESFTQDPAALLQQVAEFCGFEWEATDLERASSGVRSQNHKWRERFTDAEIELLNKGMAPVLSKYDYE